MHRKDKVLYAERFDGYEAAPETILPKLKNYLCAFQQNVRLVLHTDSFPGYRAVQVLWLDARRLHQNTAEWYLPGIVWMISVVIVYFGAETPACRNLHLKYMKISSIVKYVKLHARRHDKDGVC